MNNVAFRMFLLALMSCILVLAGCAKQQLLKETASGYAEGVFVNSTVEAVRSKILDGCSSKGLLIQESSDNNVVCGKTVSGNDELLAIWVIGNMYSTKPERKVKFTIYQMNSDVKVIESQWLETQMPGGQIQKKELNGNSQRNNMQQFLFSLGAQ